jgi:hypothetical protein
VRLSRDVAQITMDLDGIENMNVRALGSADTVTVGDLTGTGVTNANVDLTGFDGNGDGAADTVNVNGTAGADNVDVSSSAGNDVVSGLATQVQVAGGEAADNVNVNTLGGDDTTSGGVDFTGSAPVTIDGGTGNDTTTYKGSAAADTIGIARNGVDKVATFTATGAPVNVTEVENLDVQGLGGADQIIGQNGIAGLTKLTMTAEPTTTPSRAATAMTCCSAARATTCSTATAATTSSVAAAARTPFSGIRAMPATRSRATRARTRWPSTGPTLPRRSTSLPTARG